MIEFGEDGAAQVVIAHETMRRLLNGMAEVLDGVWSQIPTDPDDLPTYVFRPNNAADHETWSDT